MEEFVFKQPVSKEIYEKKYALHGEQSVEETFRGVAKELASVEENKEYWEEKFYDVLVQSKFIPAGRILANARVDSPMKNYMNCFVIPIEDSMESIYTTIRNNALVAKAGGGCVAADSTVLVKDKGLIPIQEVKKGDFVYSFNTTTQEKEFKEVLECHTPIVEKERQLSIRLDNSTTLITSTTHPTLIYGNNGFEYIPAQDIKAGDFMVKFLLPDVERANVSTEEIPEDIAWWVGAYLGDGSTDIKPYKTPPTSNYMGLGLDRKKCRLRLSKKDKHVVTNFCHVYNKYTGAKNTVNSRFDQRRYKVPVWQMATSGPTAYAFVEKYVGQFSLKKYTCYIPAWVFNSSRRVILSFIAGLIDTDGYVGRRRVEFTTASKQMQTDLLLLLSLLDVEYVVHRTKPPRGFSGQPPKHNNPHYVVLIEDRSFMSELLPYLVNSQRIEGIKTLLNSKQEQRIAVVPEMYNIFRQHQVLSVDSINRYKVSKKNVSSIRKIMEMVSSKGTQNEIEYMESVYKLGQNLAVVREVSPPESIDEQFYDLTVEGNNNYFAGVGGLSVIHNTGNNMSSLRPKGASISKGGESSGPLSFLDVMDMSAKAIHTGGNRRAASLSILNIDHPDIEEYITYKQGDSNNKLTQFNISVGTTDAFMQQVEKDGDWDLQFEGKVYKTVKARYLYDLITKNMYEHNEPGVLFLDTVNRNNAGRYMYEITSTNPCGFLATR